jgi:hypothetical protein
MPDQQGPKPDDVVIRQHAADSFTIRTNTGAAQIACRSLEGAMQRAKSFATHAHVAIWLTTDGQEFKALADL